MFVVRYASMTNYLILLVVKLVLWSLIWGLLALGVGLLMAGTAWALVPAFMALVVWAVKKVIFFEL